MCCRSNVNSAFRTIHKCTKHFKDIPGCFDVATEIKKQIEDFKPFIPLIQGLRNQGMRNRHWEQVCIHVYAYMHVSSVCVCVRICMCLYVLLRSHFKRRTGALLYQPNVTVCLARGNHSISSFFPSRAPVSTGT